MREHEEALEENFTEILSWLHFDEEVLDWMRRALRESQADEQRFREDSVERLQTELHATPAADRRHVHG
ncbi:MAG: hypothetical protein JWN70_3100 [Planctomycetaceae bacterium]|nr:hypothetical protein [Planctomycetaceae bacterium]